MALSPEATIAMLALFVACVPGLQFFITYYQSKSDKDATEFGPQDCRLRCSIILLWCPLPSILAMIQGVFLLIPMYSDFHLCYYMPL
jgi:hypothetical protein